MILRKHWTSQPGTDLHAFYSSVSFSSPLIAPQLVGVPGRVPAAPRLLPLDVRPRPRSRPRGQAQEVHPHVVVRRLLREPVQDLGAERVREQQQQRGRQWQQQRRRQQRRRWQP